MDTSKTKAIQDLRKALDKRYKDSTELFPDFTRIKQIPVVPTSSAIINAITGVGGLPKGRLTEIYGPFSSGKTTIATEVVAAGQRQNPEYTALYVDFEHAFDARYARALGVDLSEDRLIFAQPDYFEQGADIVTACVENDLVDIVVIDSAAAMTPKSEMEGVLDKTGGTQKGEQAALMSKFLSQITKKINRGRKPPLVLINQTRAKFVIGGRAKKNEPPEQSAAGSAIKFYSSLRMELEIINPEGDENRGQKGVDQIYTQNRVRVTCIKNKVAPPFMRGKLVIEYGKGINNVASIGELAEAKLGIMSGAGFFKYEGDTPETTFSCRGREAFHELLKSRPALLKEIEQKVVSGIREEHAKALGLDAIVVEGKAKEMDYTSGNKESTILSEDSEGPDMPINDA